MNISPNDEKIQKYLDELSEEYKGLLFNALLERSKFIDDISISELLRIDNEVKKPLFINYQKQQHRRKLLITTGITYALIGLTTFLFYYIIESNLIFRTDRIITLISLVFMISGLFIVALAYILPISKKGTQRFPLNISKNETNKILFYNVIAEWRELEGIVNDLAEDNNLSTPRSTIEYLFTNNLIDENESCILKNFLKIRNSIVHSSDIPFSYDEIKELSNQASIIILKLKKIL